MRRRDLEAELLGVPGVAEVACADRAADPAGTPRRVAYVVPGAGVDLGRLRRRLAAVPAAAVSAGESVAVVFVDQLPRTADGQPDLDALDAVPVVTPREVRRLGRELGDTARVELARAVRQAPRVHLADLDPSWRPVAGTAPPPSRSTDSGATAAGATAAGATAAGATDPAAGPPAECRGADLTLPADAARTLPEALRRAAVEHAERGVRVVEADGTEAELRYPVLLDRARRVLAGLREAGLRPGDPVLLQVPLLREYFPAFWACVLGGMRPVTVAQPPSYDARNAVLDKLVHTWRALDAPVVLAAGSAVPALRRLPDLAEVAGPDGLDGFRVLDVTGYADAAPAPDAPDPDPAEVALMQLSSGSTGAPKVIQITHRGIAEMIVGARADNLIEPGEVTFNWLPFDHVVPLVTCHVRDVFLGCEQVHCATPLVAADPLRWLAEMDKHRVAHSWAPNFGYRLVAEALRAAPGRHFDLTCVRTLVNAGEQCTLPVMREFAEATAPFGVTADALLLSWGMAETCTTITFTSFAHPGAVRTVRSDSLGGELRDAQPGTPGATVFLSMGRPTVGTVFRVVGPDGVALPERWIGRLQLRSGRVTPGYLNNPEANAEAFTADGWFDTGDLAFLADGEVTITGRAKELIIINGANHYCYDLEDTVSEVSGVRPGLVAACGVPAADTGSEALVIFFVPSTDLAAVDPSGEPAVARVARELRTALVRRHQLPVALAVPVAEAEFPRTTSGKIQRTKLRTTLLDGGFDAAIRALDLAEGNARTAPDCVYEWRWTALEPAPPPVATGLTVVCGPPGPVTRLAAGLSERIGTAAVVAVQFSEGYAREPDRYRLDPLDAGGWDALFRSLDGAPARLVYVHDGADDPAVPLLLAYQALVRCFGLDRGADRPVELVTVSRGLHRIPGSSSAEQPVDFRAAVLPAVVEGISRETPGIDAWHLDLPAASEDAAVPADELVEALEARRDQSELAWRDGRPYVRRLVPVPLDSRGTSADTDAAPDLSGGYLVTGGLGGVGQELLRDLLHRYPMRVLLVGRTDLDASPEHRAAFDRLAALGDVSYRAVDVCDAPALARAVAEAEERWAQPLAGVLHLAGSMEFRLLADTDPAAWQRAVAAKTRGTLAVDALLAERPDARLIASSSLITVFPAVGGTAYTAANRFLEAYCEHRRASGAETHCLSWGVWRDTGMSRDNPFVAHVGQRGLLTLEPREARALHRALLGRSPGQYLIGVDATAEEVRLLAAPDRPSPLELPTVTWAGGVSRTGGTAPTLVDALGRPVPCQLGTGEPPAAQAGSPSTDRVVTSVNASVGRAAMTRRVAELVRAVAPDARDTDRPFHELGIGSMQLLQLHGRLRDALGTELDPTTLFAYPTIEALAAHLAGSAAGPDSGTAGEAGGDRRIAIIAMAGRFPGADSVDEFWENVRAGVRSIRRFSPDELAAAGLPADRATHPEFVPASGVLSDVAGFDAAYFGLSAREAALTEPAQRLFLECCHTALEYGGYAAGSPALLAGGPDGTRVGVFAGSGMNLYALQSYLLTQLDGGRAGDDPVEALQVAIGNQPDFLATRVAHRLGLTGPAVNVQTACSTSLVALHLASRALLAGDADLALAGAAAVHVPQVTGYRYRDGSILSRTGECRAFDKDADGTVGGNGVAAVLLKRYDRAVADGDTIHAVILGSAVNNDGAAKVGFTAPSVEGQVQVVRQALAAAAVDAGTIGYVEAHGTGTHLGDPIEVRALTEAYRADSAATGWCTLGSVKSNIGHLDSCAGMAGLIKAVQVLKHRTLPPQVALSTPNPDLRLESSPFVLRTEAVDWSSSGPRRAAVSAFGVGGTNAHVILEEAPVAPEPDEAPGPVLLPLSARSPEALDALVGRYRDALPDADLRLADLVTTAALGRRHDRHRLVAIADTAAGLAAALGSTGPALVRGELPRDGAAPVAFLFPGQGSPYPGMGRSLYQRFGTFREVVDECEAYHRDVFGTSLRDWLLGTGSSDGLPTDSPLRTDVAQPAIFAHSVALAHTWRELGVVPDLVAGHSVGEYAAFCVVGSLRLLDGLQVTAMRGRLMRDRTEPGAMVVVFADRGEVDQVRAQLPGLDLAVVNGPENHVLAGPPAVVDHACQVLDGRGVRWRRLSVDRAFHSALLDPVLDTLDGYLADLDWAPLTVPVASTVPGAAGAAGGAALSADGAGLLPVGWTPDPEYFRRQARQPARFDRALAAIGAAGSTPLVLEVGPSAGLAGLARAALPGATVLPGHRRDAEVEAVLRAFATLYCQGVPVDWAALQAGSGGRRVPLPTYPLARTPYWIDQPKTDAGSTAMTDPAPPPSVPSAAVPSAAVPSAVAEPAVPAPGPVPAAGSAPVSDPEAPLAAVVARVCELTAGQLGGAAAAIDPDASFFDLGADSLLMINMIRDLEKAFGVRIAMRELFEEADTPQVLGALVLSRMDDERIRALVGPAVAPAAVAPPQAAPPATGSLPAAPAVGPLSTAPAVGSVPGADAVAVPAAPDADRVPAAGSDAGAVARVVDEQLALMSRFSDLMAQQLALLNGTPAGTAPTSAPTAPTAPTAPAAPTAGLVAGPPAATGSVAAEATPTVHGPRVTVPRGSGATGSMTDEQRAHLTELTARYTAKTGRSKEIAQRYRRVLADSRAIVGFRGGTKEMLYPIAGSDGRGSRIRDVDGNEYVDITMGFGILLFGHEPGFVTEAVRSHLSRGIQLGPRNVETGEAAQLLSELTGMERVAFANSGTEANSAAIRLARAATGRDTIVMFHGSYHGHADNVLGRSVGSGTERETVPVSTGIPGSAVADLVVLDYGDPDSLRVIEELGPRVAAVLVEPVQSRHPALQPGDFLRDLRDVTRRHGSVLLFDEMLTGFRPHPRGAQGVFGVTPDLVTYGKVLGGGFPIGAIAGRADLMDGIDGGFWRYGDDSYPPRDTTFFGGTYIQHPVSMVAARAVLTHLRQQSPDLQRRLNATTDELAGTLNAFFAEEEFPVRINHFGSMFRFEHRANLELLYHHLLLRGVFVWEWRNFFLSTAHTSADVEFVIDAVRGSLRDLRAGGFFPRERQGRTPAAALSKPVASPATVARTGGPVPGPAPGAARTGGPDFSLSFFGDYPRDAVGPETYRVLLDSARFADEHGFHAVWLPERHFHSFGGIFPNPSVLAAALATTTARIRLHAGSVVLPLHDPIRVAEEWAVVDNLSGGRVGLGCASGWSANDFVFFPDRFGRHKELMYAQLDELKTLWRGEPVRRRSGTGAEVDITLYPRPVQPEPPLYTAIVGNPDSYRLAAEHDLGVLTNLMTQTVEQLAENIALYRRTRAEHGLDPDAGRVVVLMHTYLDSDAQRARDEAYQPFCDYLRSSLALFGGVTNSLGFSVDLESAHEEDLAYLLEQAYQRYCESRALIGDPAGCARIVEAVHAAGADELACFVDFGVPGDKVRAGLPVLNQLRERYARLDSVAPVDDAVGTAPTPGQRRIWLLEQMRGSTAEPMRTARPASPPVGGPAGPPSLPNTGYHELAAVRLDGRLDVSAFQQALRQLVVRHPVLRTVFVEVDGEPRRVAQSPDTVDCPVLDATRDEDAELRAVVERESTHRYDLARGPLFRPRLLRFSDTHHVLVLAMHHLVVDAVSAQILTRELSACYRAWLDGAPAELPALTAVPPADEQDHGDDLAYWREQLRDVPALALPTDRPRPELAGTRGRAVFDSLDPDLSSRLRELSRGHRVTLFMTLLAGFGVTLQRLSGQYDVVVGTPVSDRPDGTEDEVGFFANTLALRLDLSGEPSFTELLRRVRATTLEAHEHAGAPFEDVVAVVNPDRDPSRHPLFQVMLEFENVEPFRFELPGVRATPLPVAADKSIVDLTLYLTDRPDGVRCHLEYSTDLFDDSTAARLLDTFRAVLTAAVTDPAAALPAVADPPPPPPRCPRRPSPTRRHPRPR